MWDPVVTCRGNPNDTVDNDKLCPELLKGLKLVFKYT